LIAQDVDAEGVRHAGIAYWHPLRRNIGEALAPPEVDPRSLVARGNEGPSRVPLSGAGGPGSPSDRGTPTVRAVPVSSACSRPRWRLLSPSRLENRQHAGGAGPPEFPKHNRVPCKQPLANPKQEETAWLPRTAGRRTRGNWHGEAAKELSGHEAHLRPRGPRSHLQNAKTAASKRICTTSMRLRPFCPVNDDHFDRTLLRAQAQPQLQLNRLEDRRTVPLDGRHRRSRR
jgi:hypothetical protein